MCTFRASMPVMGTGTGLRQFVCPDRKEMGGPPALAGTREYEQSNRNR